MNICRRLSEKKEKYIPEIFYNSILQQVNCTVYLLQLIKCEKTNKNMKFAFPTMTCFCHVVFFNRPCTQFLFFKSQLKKSSQVVTNYTSYILQTGNHPCVFSVVRLTCHQSVCTDNLFLFYFYVFVLVCSETAGRTRVQASQLPH